jgi:hypothetical protein
MSTLPEEERPMIATLVLAATLVTAEAPKEPPKDFKRWQFYGSMAVADMATSEFAWSRHAVEGNPLMLHGRLQAYGIKVGLTVVVVESDRLLSRRYSPWVKYLFRSLVGSWYAFWTGKALYHGMNSK